MRLRLIGKRFLIQEAKNWTADIEIFNFTFVDFAQTNKYIDNR